jgi:organic hydroperoxide reductase OsmC/OhrA
MEAQPVPRRSPVIRTHSYDVTVAWTGNRGSGTSGYREYGRDHEVTVTGTGDENDDAERPRPIAGSSDSTFRGDAVRWNPEQLLLAALARPSTSSEPRPPRSASARPSSLFGDITIYR